MNIGSLTRILPNDVRALLSTCPGFVFARDADQVRDLAFGADAEGAIEVAYDVPGIGRVVEAVVVRTRNGIAVNYPDPAMRRRDPDCMLVADDQPSDKPRFGDQYGESFDGLRRKTLDWLATQELICFAFKAGGWEGGVHSLVVTPKNAAFFAYTLALLQGVIDPEVVEGGFDARSVIFVAPPFRHTFFGGKQMVVHNRLPGLHELFSYNLYPGPSAKKGVYGVLLNVGEEEGWLTAHCSTVQVVTPYDNVVTFMHEGASGGGKSEMLEQVHREPDGRLLLGENVVTGERRHLVLPRACELRPVTDDMALCHPEFQQRNGKLSVIDAESAWFVRVNHITKYGTDPNLEALTVAPPVPLAFLNIEAVSGATTLLWEHVEDQPGKKCPNPRVILPRKIVPDIVDGPVQVDIRGFGVRTPPCTIDSPSYGILGILHVIPPALAWLWRLVAPRGHDNPSVTDSEGMVSEGVGSYWPFATGLRVEQANLLLRQFREAADTGYVLCPNQHVGAWRVGFMPQWIAREYLARRGSARFRDEQLQPARCPLLGYVPRSMMVEGTTITRWLTQVETQPEVGIEAYDKGAEQLREFFEQTLNPFMNDSLEPLGRRIIDRFFSGAAVEDYVDVWRS